MGDSTDSTQGTKDPLYVASRAQLNFAENVPLVLAVALLAELNGANRLEEPIGSAMLCLLTPLQNLH
ncbi:MAG: MAPEG family protein [Cytophagaceae bacterium]|nr:MAG: MAPEG family protein [Cytophagaceae bacterium]